MNIYVMIFKWGSTSSKGEIISNRSLWLQCAIMPHRIVGRGDEYMTYVAGDHVIIII